MWPVVGGLISGLGSFFGAEQTNQQSAANVAAQNQFNAQQQQQAEQYNTQSVQQQEAFNASQVGQQEQFQQSMSNTAYQRASADMKAAGLNPSAMFGSGGPASVPSGAAASSSAPSISPNRSAGIPQYQSPISSMGDIINHTISNAVQAKTMDMMTDQMAQIQANILKTNAETSLTQKEGVTEDVKPSLLTQQKYLDTARQVAINAGMPSIWNAAKTATNQMNMNDTLRQALDIGSFAGVKVGDTLSPITSLINSAKNLGRWYW